jgi:hypothetical protein
LPIQAAETAVVQEILDGQQLCIDRQQAREQDKARAPEPLSTADSPSQIGFHSGAAGRMNWSSQMKLGQGCFLPEKGLTAPISKVIRSWCCFQHSPDLTP